MALYSYKKTKFSRLRKIVKFISVISIFIGVFIIFIVTLPIINFELFYSVDDDSLVQPFPKNNDISTDIIHDLPKVLGMNNLDYTKASVWFPKASSDINTINSNITSYEISIPKIKIDKAKVTVGEEDLTRSLIHFTGPLPPNNGNPVIFGHSTLIYFYNPKDYKTIFSKLPELKNNDDIYVIIDNVTYQYKVFEMKVVYPEDISVLEQKNDNAYITLITCVPPGTYFKRLIVRGKLIRI